MIESLTISNYALISSISIDFDPKFNIITGETGAGKSIIIGALSLILGGRADMATIRDKSKKTVVEAIFNIENLPLIASIIASYNIDSFGSRCILRREISNKGGSRAFINDTPVNLAQLRSVALQLIDIHSQHQNLLLATPEYQLSIIDALAANSELLDEYSVAYNEYRRTLSDYKSVRLTIEKSRNDADFLAYQLEQLNELDLVPGEQAQLESERAILANAAQITERLDAVTTSLDGEVPVTASISTAIDRLADLSEIYPDSDDLISRLQTAKIELQDIADTINGYRNELDVDPKRLIDIENRLSSIYSLQTKYHVDTDTALIELRDKLALQLDLLNDSDTTLAKLEEDARHAKKAAVTIARRISERRAETARDFADTLRQRAIPLGMQNIQCEISVTPTKLMPTGMDNVEFLFAFNKNQSLRPIGNTASGGETSRLILAVKSIIAEKIHMPTIIFDEVDTGVSGDIAVRMGQLMAEIASSTQVITITHLPQVAAMGDTHFKVYKLDTDTATETNISRLDRDSRITEIAIMLSGNGDDITARAAAESLLNKVNN